MNTAPPSSVSSPSGVSRPLTRREAIAAERVRLQGIAALVSVPEVAVAPTFTSAPTFASAPTFTSAPASTPAPAALPVQDAEHPVDAAAAPSTQDEAPSRRMSSARRAAAAKLSRTRARTRPNPHARSERPLREVRRTVSKRRVGTSVLSVVAMGFVAAVTVATSVPADALLSSEQLQARQLDQSSGTVLADGQIITADGVVLESLPGDAYAAESRFDYAKASGLRLADTFTNNPRGTIQWPFAVGVPIGDRFGSTYGRDSAHNGLDFNPGYGAPIQAIADGVVSFAEDGAGELGTVIMIDHVINGQIITSVYAHAITGSLRFGVGDRVRVGDVVALTGDTGYSTGPHLHFEIRIGGRDGQQVDPLAWLRANTN